MKNTLKRFSFGLISSLLLAVGFAQAADRFDPISSAVNVGGQEETTGITATWNCISTEE